MTPPLLLRWRQFWVSFRIPTASMSSKPAQILSFGWLMHIIALLARDRIPSSAGLVGQALHRRMIRVQRGDRHGMSRRSPVWYQIKGISLNGILTVVDMWQQKAIAIELTLI